MAKDSLGAELALPRVDRELEGYGTVTVELNQMFTDMLLYDAANFGKLPPLVILLVALVQATRELTGQTKLLVNMETHGREELDKPIDITRTVGWFTSFYPLVLKTSAFAPDTLYDVFSAYRDVPNKGVGFALLKDRITVARPNVTLNYMGVMDREMRYTSGEDFSRENPFPEDVSINASVINECLVTNFYYNTSAYDEQTMGLLARTFNEKLKQQMGYIVRASLEFADQAGGTELVDYYNLSPLQQGMLFHYLNDPSTTEYVVQFCLRLDYEVNPRALEKAAQFLTLRHDSLRTAIVTDDVLKPKQGVFAQRPPRFAYEDLMPYAVGEREEIARAYAEEDVRRGFDLLRDPSSASRSCAWARTTSSSS